MATQYGKVFKEGSNNKYVRGMNLSLAFLKSKASSVVIISDACSKPFVESNASLCGFLCVPFSYFATRRKSGIVG